MQQVKRINPETATKKEERKSRKRKPNQDNTEEDT